MIYQVVSLLIAFIPPVIGVTAWFFGILTFITFILQRQKLPYTFPGVLLSVAFMGGYAIFMTNLASHQVTGHALDYNEFLPLISPGLFCGFLGGLLFIGGVRIIGNSYFDQPSKTKKIFGVAMLFISLAVFVIGNAVMYFFNMMWITG